MTRAQLIQFIRENDPYYSQLTFAGHTLNDLRWIKRTIEVFKEKKKKKKENDIAPLPKPKGSFVFSLKARVRGNQIACGNCWRRNVIKSTHMLLLLFG